VGLIRLDVLMSVSTESTVSFDVTPCSLVDSYVQYI
jgi:hypothetical protein